MKKVLAVVFSLLIIGLVTAYLALAEIGYQGSAYAAKNLCSGVFVSKLSADTVMQQAVIPASPPLAWASYFIDRDKDRVKASMLGLYAREAQFRPGLGCTLIPRHLTALPVVDLPVSLSPPTIPVVDDNATNPDIDYRGIETALDYAFAENDPGGNKNTKAVVVMHDGNVIAERYAEGVTAQTPLTGWSMSKSVTNILVGILVRDGELDIDAPAPIEEWQKDERRNITVNNLLHMSSGLAFNETYGIATDVTQMLTAEADAGTFAASKPLMHLPGQHWDYSSGTTNIIARIVQQKVGGDAPSLYAFSQTELFQPLNIQSAHFEPDPSGVFVGSSFLYANARDWGKLGQLMLNKGRWQNRVIVSEDWVDYSLRPAPANKDKDYGAHFWLNREPEDSNQQRTWPDVPTDAFSMNGYQGQYVVVIPSHDLVVVRLGFTPRPARPDMNKLLSDIISAVNP